MGKTMLYLAYLWVIQADIFTQSTWLSQSQNHKSKFHEAGTILWLKTAREIFMKITLMKLIEAIIGKLMQLHF